jgi:hypothetical protein
MLEFVIIVLVTSGVILALEAVQKRGEKTGG